MHFIPYSHAISIFDSHYIAYVSLYCSVVIIIYICSHLCVYIRNLSLAFGQMKYTVFPLILFPENNFSACAL